MNRRQPQTPERPPEEQAFLDAYDPSAFDRPSVSVDVVLLTIQDEALHTLVIQRPDHPFKGDWMLPGGFVRMEEPFQDAAERVLRDKAGLSGVFLEQLYTFGAPDRDPRTRVISVAHVALVDEARFRAAQLEAHQGALARLEIPWEGETGGPVELLDRRGRRLPMAFDHADMVGMAVKRLRGKLDYTPIGFQLLPERFTLFQLQKVHETVLGRPLNKDSFRRRMLASGQLAATGESQRDVEHRPAALYRFNQRSAV